jgi:hypothetical protein
MEMKVALEKSCKGTVSPRHLDEKGAFSLALAGQTDALNPLYIKDARCMCALA